MDNFSVVANGISWGKKKRRYSDHASGVRLVLLRSDSKSGKGPRLRIYFGRGCGEVTKAKYAQYSELNKNSTVLWFNFSCDKKEGDTWFKCMRGPCIEPTLNEEEVQVFHDIWEREEGYDLQYDTAIGYYYIVAGERRRR